MDFIFHIGAGKTGSSAIQHALATNRALLEENGFYIPSEDLSEDGKLTGYHVWWFENLKKELPESASDIFAKSLENVVLLAEQQKCTKIIFSAENLSNTFNWSDVITTALSGYKVKVCIYIRRQDDYLLSAWQQWGIKTGHTLDQWLLKNIGVSGDWSLPINEWQKIATDPVEVRVYQKNKLKNEDVVDDFFSYLEIDSESISRSKSNVNSSYGIAVEELALSGAHLFEGAHDNNFYNMLGLYCKKAHTKKPGESRLSASDRRSIMERYSQSNNWIQQEYFTDQSTPLFTPPQDGQYNVLSKSEIEDRKWALIAELVYGMHNSK